MGICGKNEGSKEKGISNDIDGWLKEDYNRQRQIKQLLLLGTGESGKSTIIKQMKILHINGFTEEEKHEQISNIKQNVHDSIYTLVYQMKKISPPINLVNEESKKSADYILEIGPKEPAEYSQEYFNNVKSLWADPGVKAAYLRSNEFQLIDSALHFLDRINEIQKPDYIPTVQDMLFCRITTTGISKIEFEVPHRGKQIKFNMYDVGGQRGERKKWIQVFDGIEAILFLIAASDFDQTLREDEQTNRLAEALQLFNDLFWSRFLKSAGKIVFLNKQDILEKKLEQGKRIEKYFPEYKNFSGKGKPSSEFEKAKRFLEHKIQEISNTPPQVSPDPHFNVADVSKQDIYIHFTIATDTNNIRFVFDSVKDMILQKTLNEIVNF